MGPLVLDSAGLQTKQNKRLESEKRLTNHNWIFANIPFLSFVVRIARTSTKKRKWEVLRHNERLEEFSTS